MANSIAMRESMSATVPAAEPVANRAGLALVYVFVVGLVMPIEMSVNVGLLRLSPYRIVLLAALFPCFISLLSGRAGRLSAVDGLVVLHAVWAALALFVRHGVRGSWEFAGIYVIETLGPYFLARLYIRSAADVEAFAKFVLLIVIVLVPIAAYESLTGHILRNPPEVEASETRLGLNRSFGPFEHPILFGVFCGSMLGIAYFSLKDRSTTFMRLFRCGAVGLGAFFSLSAGPLTAVLVQSGLILWNRLTRRIPHRWYLLAGCGLASWTVVSLLSNRTPVHVFITYFTFSVHNAYTRIHIWDYGTQEVARHPVFGIGFGEWQRPGWMGGSMDNFWLLEAMRYGLPALFFLVAALALLFVRIGRRRDLDRRTANHRRGWMITMVGLIFAGFTVHYWNAIFCLVMFLIGSGAWLASAPAEGAPGAAGSRPGG